MTELSGYVLETVRKGGEFILYRGRQRGNPSTVLVLAPIAEQPAPASLRRLEHEYSLAAELDPAWAARPLALTRHEGRTFLVLSDPGGEPMDRILDRGQGQPLELTRCLRVAIGLATAVGQVHRHGLIHKDIKPANVLVDDFGNVRLTRFGIASQLPREFQAPAPPEVIAGTLAYMAPEQTGRMNRSIDARSDLYSLGVTLYQMLTGTLPFAAADPLEWIHCHIARQPTPPGERAAVPAPLSAITMKLLAKTAEERYQTAAGLEADLLRCLAEWEAHGRIDLFPLGAHDASDRLLIPGILYGREREIDTLLAAFDRVVAKGTPELVLVSGYSGVGKSSIVSELHKALVPSRGLFASGKFDQYKRDIPYATLAQAFQSLIRPLLGKSEAELAGWRDALHEALGPNGQLIIDVIPELKLLIGEQPPVPELPPQQAQSRLQLVFRRFLGVFARPEHPLTLFLDDLQWLDAATLDMLADLLTQADVQWLLVIGAYRDHEVNSAHPLMRKLDAIRKAGARVQEIVLAPLGLDDVGQLIADALHCAPNRAAPLARLVLEKTGGNPFFAIQFLTALSDEGLLAFDYGKAGWSWDLGHIQAKGFTDNVVELMVGKLGRLPVEVQKALQWLACLGNVAEITLFSIVLGKSNEDVRSDLWDAVRLELVEPLEGSYKFIHDRVQEAAYSLIPERLRAEAHLRVGRLLAAHTPAEKREETIFEIVNQLNRGAGLIVSRDEREQLAELNLLAGQRAKTTTAYASALTYLVAGAALLPEDSWERRHDLAFALELQRGECEFLTGVLAEAEQRLATLSTRAASTVERARLACLRVDLYTTMDQSSRALAVGVDYLRHVGIEWSPHPTEAEARREYQRIWPLIGGRAIEDLIQLPLMTDPASLATMDLLTRLEAPASFSEPNLHFLIESTAVILSLERGNSDGSCFAYEWIASVAGPIFGDYKTGFRFAQLGYELVEQRGLRRFQAKTYLNFGSLMLWTKPIRGARDLLRRAFDVATKTGNFNDAAFASYLMTTNLLAAGDPLVDAQREAEHGLAFARKMGFGLVIDIAVTQLALVRTLRGLTPKFGSFDDEDFEELRVERRLVGNLDLARAECWYWTRKGQARFFAGDNAAAVDALSKAQKLLWASPSNFEVVEHCFYGALSLAACCDTAAAGERQQHVAALATHHRQLEVWAENCPDNFANRAALVGAEIARIEGRTLDAMDLYERAIRSARANGFVHNEALAYEIAARFYLARGFETIGHAYLRNARNCYDSWGALGKVRQLDQRYPRLREESASSPPTATIGASVEQLDVGTMVKAAQAVSGEIVLGKLIETLMRIAVEHAGAERGLLILLRGDEPRIEAEAITGGGRVEVTQRQAAVTPSALPESVLHYVIRTRESVTLDDAAAPTVFAADAYVQQQRPRSVLCFPLVKQAKLVGALYLENNLTPRAFTSDRIAVLELLASQAAISLENARLYRDLEQREAKIRRLVDANIIGIYLWELEGRIIEANDTFLRMVGYDREDLVSGRVRWTDLTPPEWRDRSARNVEQVKMTGSLQPHEKELFRKDGSRVPVLLGSAAFDEQRDQGVAFVLDLTERKRGEEALRNAQADLTRVARLTTMGELAASIAHEINQPLASMVNNGEACLLWLANDKPDLDEARLAAERIITDAHRAGDIIRSIRALARKSGPEMTELDINDAIREVLTLVRTELHQHDVSLETALSEGLEPIMGDRVQLQQVILNLIMNGIEAMSAVLHQTPVLRVSSHVDGPGDVLIAVEDSGPGLAPETMDRLFEPFFTTKPSGMGMGLSICRSIVDAHGGRLWASPQSPRGAVFRFTVPTVAKRDS